LMDKPDDAARAMDDRHPDFGAHLGWIGLSIGISDVRALQRVPDDFIRPAPFAKLIDAFGDQPEIVLVVGLLIAGDGVDIEAENIAALNVGEIIARLSLGASPVP